MSSLGLSVQMKYNSDPISAHCQRQCTHHSSYPELVHCTQSRCLTILILVYKPQFQIQSQVRRIMFVNEAVDREAGSNQSCGKFQIRFHKS